VLSYILENGRKKKHMPGITYKSYNFVTKDPIIDQIRTVIQDSGVTFKWIEDNSGVTSQTLSKWIYGETKKPQAATINAVLRVLGKKLIIADINAFEDVAPTPYRAPPERERTPNNKVAKYHAAPKMQYDPNDESTWSRIVGRPNRTLPPEPETFRGKGKVVSRSFNAIPSIETKK
jgi:hypothetical protein